MCRIYGVKRARGEVMTYFNYIQRQRQLIRDRHSGEEVLFAGGQAYTVRQGEHFADCATGCARGAHEEQYRAECACGSYKDCRAECATKPVEELLRELGAMKGLNRRERERFAGAV